MRTVLIVAMFIGGMMPWTVAADLIVLAAPRTGDPYYADVADAIFDFHVAFATRVQTPDRVLVLVDEGAYDDYADVLGKERVLQVPMDDIWARDFGTLNTVDPVMFRYTAAGQGGGRQGQRDADAVQEGLAALAEDAGVRFAETDLLNDGGNFVDDGFGNAVISTKFLADNDMTEDQARDAVKRITGVTNVAFIDADEQGGLEHADGVVSFVDKNTLIVNSYPEDPTYAAKLNADLRRGLPGIEIHEIVTPYDGSEIYDDRFGSACGLYTNALVTEHHVYLPEFGISEDAEALATVKALTRKQIIGIPSAGVCHMGGGVRCMSWQLKGEQARALLGYAR